MTQMSRSDDQHRRIRGRAAATGRRPGVVLFVVVTIVLLVTLITYGLLMVMRDQNLAAAGAGDRLQARQAALSARDVFAAWLESSRAWRDDIERRNFRGQHPSVVALKSGDDAADDDTFPFGVVLAPESGAAGGPANESARIHLQTLLDIDARIPGWGRTALLRLPGMTETIADHLLDWIDSDDIPRDFGNESAWYLEQYGFPVRNAIPPALDEFLRIPGVTRERLFGVEEAPAEEPEFRAETRGDRSAAWAEYLTVFGAERNESYAGQPRTWLNQVDLAALHRTVEQALDSDMANFIVLYRQYGPARGVSSGGGVRRTLVAPGSVAVDLARLASADLASPLDLVNATVEIPVNRREVQRIPSPLRADSPAFSTDLERLLDGFTTTHQEILIGRVNINTAPREVLLAVPGIDQAMADRILAARANTSMGRESVAWLLAERIAPLETFRQLLPYLTTGGDVYRARFAGFADRHMAPFVFEAVLDATGPSSAQRICKRIHQTSRIKQEFLTSIGPLSNP